MSRKTLPLLLMLIAGAVTSITVFFRNLGLLTMLIALLASLITFYFIGSIIVYVLDSFDRKNKAMFVSDEGEVIEKEPDEESGLPSEEEDDGYRADRVFSE